MADNKVKFLRGTSDEYAAAVKDNDAIYFTTDDGKIYIGDKKISGDGSVTVDNTLSDTSTNPVQNKVVKQAIDNKADKTIATTDTDGLMSASDKTKFDSADDTYALKSKYGDTTIDVGRKAGTTVGNYSTAEGHYTTASGKYSHAEGVRTTASGDSSHAEGSNGTASGNNSHTEGYNTIASGQYSHAEGGDTESSGSSSHAEGYRTTASGKCSHAEGSNTDLSGISLSNRTVTISDVDYTIIGSNAYGINSHAEGTQSFAYGYSSHAEGRNTTASGNYSHTSGYYTKALHDNEAAYGKYNESNDDTLFSIGDGTADDARHNAFEITTTGGKLHDNDIATTNNISNPNLLINPDFRINQRGISGEFSETGKYFVDRWKLVSGTVTVNSDRTITLNGSICQVFEIGLDTNVTASVSAGAITADVVHVNTGEAYVDSVTISAEGETISWAKLEIGSTATPFSPPDPATELLKCQRYYQIHNLARQRVWYYTADMLAFFLPNKVLMRSGCTATINGTLAIFALDNRNQSGFNFVIEWAIANGVKVCAKKTAHGLTDAILYVNGLPSNGRIEIDAEIY